ncbi:MAG: putative transcriptional regulator [halophilic archaeon J07HB67]|nr:MAG: putative transcriptional regulator [halophilic archaeon J07HB67]
MDDTEITRSLPALVDDNGLTKLFANRVRAQILVALLYADEPLTVAEVADAVGVAQSTVYEALDRLVAFDLFETDDETAVGGTDDLSTTDDPATTDNPGDGSTRYALADDDELVAAIERLARIATERRYPADETDE